MTKWRIAIVGAGYMASEHAKALAALPSVEIAGIFSRTRVRAEALAATYGKQVYDSLAALHDEAHADAVVVSVNELAMAETCANAFQYPWICLLEKPVGIDLREAEAIRDDASRRGARVFVALNRRSYSATRQAMAILAGDNAPRLISILDQEDMEAALAAGQPEAVVQNWMYANSIHLIDYFTFLGRGEIVAVEPAIPWTPEVPGFVAATIRYASGDRGLYQAVWNAPGPWSVSITTRAMRLEMRPVETLGIQRRGERRLTDVPIDPIDAGFKPGLLYQAEQLVAALEGKPSSLATLDEATRSMALCAQIYRAM